MARTVPKAIQIASLALQLKNAKGVAWGAIQGQMAAMIGRVRSAISATILAKIQAITGNISIPGLAALVDLSNTAAATILTIASMYKDAIGLVGGTLPVPMKDVFNRLVEQYGQSVEDIADDLVDQFQIPLDNATRIAEAWVDEQQEELISEIRDTFQLPEIPAPPPPTFGPVS